MKFNLNVVLQYSLDLKKSVPKLPVRYLVVNGNLACPACCSHGSMLGLRFPQGRDQIIQTQHGYFQLDNRAAVIIIMCLVSIFVVR